ncbi:MAG: PEP-CTERM sorting domain-containing protein [Phycisphaerales bacterium]|jgi:hypothetical protein|nr:PEP-CTERM sorting domain-containing protein [Phycisphaerales bacterium]
MRKSKSTKLSFVVCVGVAILAMAAPGLADGIYRTVVLLDDPVAGDPPASYVRFAPAWIDKNGEAIYYAQMSGGTGYHGLWTETGGMSLEYQDETHPPGTPLGTEFDYLRGYVSNRSGQLGIVSDLDGSYPLVDNSNDTGVWSNTSGSLQLIAREGSSAPGGPVDAVFDSFTSSKPVLNDSGVMAFLADMKNGVGGVGSSDKRGIWRGTNSGDLSLVVRQNDQVPGGPVGQLHSGFHQPQINENGDLMFRGYLTGTDTTGSSSVIWAESGGSLGIIARQGNPAPIVGSVGEEYGGTFQYANMNTNGNVVFTNRMTIGVGGVTSDNDTGLWTGAPGSFELIAREGTQAPDAPAGALSTYITVPWINALDQITFLGGLEVGTGGVTADNDRAIWSTASGSTEIVVREGDAVPGVPGATFSSFSMPVINDAGQVAFSGTMVLGPGGVDLTNAWGIWAQLPNGDLTLAARVGDAIDVDDGPGVDFRTLTAINYTGNSGSFGNDSGLSHFFNEQGQLIFIGHFDGSAGGYGDQGVFVWDSNLVPEPTTLTMLCLGGIVMLKRKRKTA